LLFSFDIFNLKYNLSNQFSLMFGLSTWTAYWLKQKVAATSAVHRLLFWSSHKQKQLNFYFFFSAKSAALSSKSKD
jgi:hypothetical protein